MDCSPPGSFVHGILQARILQWVARPSSRGSSRLRDRTQVSCVSCLAGRWILSHYSHLGSPTNVQSIHRQDRSTFSPGGSEGKEPTCNVGDLGLISGLGRSPGEGNRYPLQYSCLENLHGQRSLVGYSPWGRKESDMTEQLSLTHSLTFSKQKINRNVGSTVRKEQGKAHMLLSSY